MLLSDLLSQPTVTYNDGDILAANTDSVGYAPSIIDTQAYARGQYTFKIKGVGIATDGVYPEYHIVPIIVAEDGKSFVDDDEHPVIIQKAGKVFYATGRNDIQSRDVYHDRQYLEVDNIQAGEEARVALNCFIKFVQSEYSLGVNDFTISPPTYTSAQ